MKIAPIKLLAMLFMAGFVIFSTTCKKTDVEATSSPMFKEVAYDDTGVVINTYCSGTPCHFRRHFYVQNIGASGTINVTAKANKSTITESFAVESNAKYDFTVFYSYEFNGTDILTLTLPGLTLSMGQGWDWSLSPITELTMSQIQ